MLARPCLALLLATLTACASRTAEGAELRTQHGSWVHLSGASEADGAGSFDDPMTLEGQGARGLYFSYGAMQLGVPWIQRTLERTRMNAAVLDLKDATGRVSHRTRVRALKRQVASPALDVRGMVQKLKRRGVYTIARITCFNDPVLASREPARAIMDARRPDKVWRSRSTAGAWLDPYNRDNHAVVLELAKEAEALGFDEIQLDYIRWPVDTATQWALYPSQVETPRYAVLLELLRDIDRAVHIPLGVDVFGLAAKNEGDPAGLGQSLGHWTSHVEVISPMLYVNGMKTWGRGSSRRAGMLIENITRHLRKRVGPTPVLRPFIQAFQTGSDHWDPAFIREQIEGAKLGEADGFLFWHPGSDYAMVGRGVRGLPDGFMPFPLAERAAARPTVE